jgi:hypothetical protein
VSRLRARSALYEVAARLPGVESGRPGVAVAMRDEVNHLRSELIFDPATPEGTRIGWAVYLRSEVVDAIRQRPGAR